MAEEKRQFPTEVIDLPSKGYFYSKDSPLSSGQVEIKYMTAREEDILTSQNLIKKGVVIEKLIDSKIIKNEILVMKFAINVKSKLPKMNEVNLLGPVLAPITKLRKK